MDYLSKKSRDSLKAVNEKILDDFTRLSPRLSRRLWDAHMRKTLFEKIGSLVWADSRENEFDGLCLEVFEYQYANNEPYRKFCEGKGVSVNDVRSWKDIPAFPSEGFKKDIIVSFPLEKMVMENLTSGTTCPEFRGAVFRDEYGKKLALDCNRKVIGDYIFPGGERMPILILAPSPETTPTMGMAIGMAETIKHFGDEGSGFFITRKGLMIKELMTAIKQFEKKGLPVAIIGATSAFVYMFNACKKNNIRFSLPKGSRIADGGGYRGKFGKCTRETYYGKCLETFNIPEEYCVNVLGMAECTTNYVDSTIRDAFMGVRRNRHKQYHTWTRVTAFDIETCSRPLPEGKVGLLRHYDLANLPTVLAVQTENLGHTTEDGFEILGRARVVDGKVSQIPSEKPVGPMGDKKIFSFIDMYSKFSISRQIKKLGKDQNFCPCGEIIDNMIEGRTKINPGDIKQP